MTVRSIGRVIKLGVLNFMRNQWLSVASTIVVAITLFIIGVFAIQSIVIVETSEGIQDKLDLTAYFNDDVPEETIQDIRRTVANRPDVKAVDYISKEQAFQLWQERRTSERIKSLITPEDNPLPRSLVVKAHDPANLKTIAKVFEGNQYSTLVRRVSYNDNASVIESLSATVKTVRRNGWILAGVFLVLSFILIYNTTRIVILSRSHEIEIMRLVGSTEAFVRWPFLIEAALFGVLGTALALGALYGFLRYDLASSTPILSIAKFLAPDMLAFYSQYFIPITLASLAIGVGLAVCMSFVAVRRFVRL
ncbi:ABC transporter permease [Candidatus Berkelbacteria bacterium]|nr:ABC transporter permease [Candidatus Berkelbacteria bacterium]